MEPSGAASGRLRAIEALVAWTILPAQRCPALLLFVRTKVASRAAGFRGAGAPARAAVSAIVLDEELADEVGFAVAGAPGRATGGAIVVDEIRPCTSPQGTLLAFLRRAHDATDAAKEEEAPLAGRRKTGGNAKGIPDQTIDMKIAVVAECRRAVDYRHRKDHQWKCEVWSNF